MLSIYSAERGLTYCDVRDVVRCHDVIWFAGVVTCAQPSVSLQKTPGGCNLKYTSSDVIKVRSPHVDLFLVWTTSLHGLQSLSHNS